MYIGITGTLASGKGEVVRVLREHGFKHYGFGDFLRESARARGLAPTVANSVLLANELRATHGADYLAKQLLRKCESDAPRHAVFESIRTLGELQALRRLPGFLLVSVDAPRDVRFERQHMRSRGDDLDTFEAFSAAEERQLEGQAHEQQLLAVMAQADIQIVNIGNLDELAQTVREQLNL